MSYTVLARRYRSQDFDEVVGQESIAQTLQMAIQTQRVAHAYLFCGTRGVGKTSMARIFAKALNVSPDLEDAQAIAAAIMRGDDIDVLEIDGASNRGVDEARELIANCIYRPARCRYKIYIIDEVHMLTKEAFNTLLKTMEEPPEHVKFILCTTEPHKVPPTIQSRCQRFDFRTIPTDLIARHLEEVLRGEEVEAEKGVVFQVARLGNGSMRDALSVLDRLISDAGGRITGQTLTDALGLPDESLVVALLDAIAQGDAAASLKAADDLLARGGSIDQMLELLIERFRTILHVALCGNDNNLLGLTDDERDQASRHVSTFDPATIVFAIALLENVQRSAKSSNTARALVDAAIVRLALSERFEQASAVLESETTGTNPAQKKTSRRADASAAPPLTTIVASAPPARTTPARPAAPTDDQPSARIDESQQNTALATAIRDDQRLAPLVDSLKWDWPQDGPAFCIRLTDPSQSAYARSRVPVLEAIVHNVMGRKVAVNLVIEKSADDPPAIKTMSAGQLDQAAQIPLVRKAIELLDARILSVEDDVNSSRSLSENNDAD